MSWPPLSQTPQKKENPLVNQERKPPTDDSSVFFLGEPGLVSMFVCAPAVMSREDIAAEVNAKSPTGLSGGWVVADESDLSDETREDITEYPVPCPDVAARRHYMVHC
jgi:hypothetical protein